MGLYLLDHQLAQSRTDPSPGPAVLADARRARALYLDPKGVRIEGIVVRRRLCRDAGRPHDLSAGIDTTCPNLGAHECGPHPGLAVDVGRLLDRGRLRGRTLAANPLGGGAGRRIYLARGPVL